MGSQAHPQLIFKNNYYEPYTSVDLYMFFPHNSAMNNNNNTSKNSSTPASRGIVIYARLSVESINGSNESLDRQISLGEKYAAFADLNILGIFSEVASGKNA